jgi:outer membrane protein assembly factor BamB
LLYILWTSPTLTVVLYAIELKSGNQLWTKLLYSSEKQYLSPIVGDDGTIYVSLYGFEGLVYIMAVGVPEGNTILITTILVTVGCILILGFLGFWKYKRSVVPSEQRGSSIWWCFRAGRKKPLWRPNRTEKLTKRKKKKRPKPTDEEKALLPEKKEEKQQVLVKGPSRWEFLASKFNVK